MIEKDGQYTWKTIKKYIDILVNHNFLQQLKSDNKKEHNYAIQAYLEILFTGNIDLKSREIQK
jgi:hypothetical protein